MRVGKANLTLGQAIALILLNAPPAILVIFDIGPARWVNRAQDTIFGWHSLELSFLAMLLLEILCIFIIAVAVRWITGYTLVELFRGKTRSTVLSRRDRDILLAALNDEGAAPNQALTEAAKRYKAGRE